MFEKKFDIASKFGRFHFIKNVKIHDSLLLDFKQTKRPKLSHLKFLKIRLLQRAMATLWWIAGAKLEQGIYHGDYKINLFIRTTHVASQ
jgi:hypothetical protein